MIDVARLKECPFCGSTHVDLCRGQIVGTSDTGMRFVRCLNCGSRSAFTDRDNAVRSWNNRPGHEMALTALHRIRAFVEATGQAYEEAALGRLGIQSRTYDEERALVCWQVLDEIDQLLAGGGQ